MTRRPKDSIPLALFSFNGGVEIGQLLFLAVAATTVAGLRRLAPRDVRLPRFERVAAYGIGSLAAYWYFQRLSLVVFDPAL